jgi:hypothetical protein
MSWTNCTKNGVLWTNKKEKDNLHTIKKREGYLDWSHLAGELPFETQYWRKDRKMRKKMYAATSDDLNETRRYWKLKEEILDCTLCKIRLGRG